MNRLLVAMTAVILGLTACGGEDGRIEALSKRISDLEEVQTKLQTEIGNLKFQNAIADWENIAFIKPAETGYTIVRFDLGKLTVKISDVKPYANGSKVLLSFGNMTTARVDGLKAKVEWGQVNEQGVVIQETTKSREVVFKESMGSGAWTDSEVVLEGTPPADLGFVRLREVGHRGISLRR